MHDLSAARESFKKFLKYGDGEQGLRFKEVQAERAVLTQYMLARIAIAKEYKKQLDKQMQAQQIQKAGGSKSKTKNPSILVDDVLVRSRAIDQLEKITNTMDKVAPDAVITYKNAEGEEVERASHMISELHIHVRRQVIDLYKRAIVDFKTSRLAKETAEKKSRTFRLIIKQHLNKLLHLVPTDADPSLSVKQKQVSLSFYVYREQCLNAVMPEGVSGAGASSSSLASKASTAVGGSDAAAAASDAAYFGHQYLDQYDKENGKRAVKEPSDNVTSVLMHVAELCKGSDAKGAGATPNASSSLLSATNAGSPAAHSAALEDLQQIFKLKCFLPALNMLLK